MTFRGCFRKNNEYTNRLIAEGFLSFIKGCSRLHLRQQEKGNKRRSHLFQATRTPAVYTKLSCFLPWIAEQYDMEFDEKIEDPNDECTQGTGNINDFNSKKCRINSRGEDYCIFPFYWNGKLKEQCVFLEEDDFLFPVFRCPTRNITRKINGINSFVYKDIIKQVEKPENI